MKEAWTHLVLEISATVVTGPANTNSSKSSLNWQILLLVGQMDIFNEEIFSKKYFIILRKSYLAGRADSAVGIDVGVVHCHSATAAS